MVLEYTQHRMHSDLRADCSSDEDEAQIARMTIREQVAAIKERLFNATALMSNREIPAQPLPTSLNAPMPQQKPRSRNAEVASLFVRNPSPSSSLSLHARTNERVRVRSGAQLRPPSRATSASNSSVVGVNEDVPVHAHPSRRPSFALDEKMTRTARSSQRVLSAHKPRSSLMEANRQNVSNREERLRRVRAEPEHAQVHVIHPEYESYLDHGALSAPVDPPPTAHVRSRAASRQEQQRLWPSRSGTPVLPVLQGRVIPQASRAEEYAPPIQGMQGMLSVIGAAAPRK